MYLAVYIKWMHFKGIHAWLLILIPLTEKVIKKEGMAFSERNENQQSSMDAFEMHPLDVNS